MVNRLNNNGIVLVGVFAMKTIEATCEWLIIVMAVVILVVPEIAYSCLLRARDWVEDCISEL